MRLDFVPEFSLKQRVKVRLMEWLMRGNVPGPILTMSYDPELFGKPFSQSLQDAMRRMRHWSLGEVELFAAWVSKQNSCVY